LAGVVALAERGLIEWTVGHIRNVGRHRIGKYCVVSRAPSAAAFISEPPAFDYAAARRVIASIGHDWESSAR